MNGKETCPPTSIIDIIGPCDSAWIGYAHDPAIREKAASGGCVTAFLTWLLDTGKIDGVVVCKTSVIEGKVRPQFFIAKTGSEIRESQGSFYAVTSFSKDVPPLLRKAEGRIAVVGLPCDLTILSHALKTNPPEKCTVVLKIGLLCSHVSRLDLVDAMTTKLGEKTNSKLTKFTFREGAWRGCLKAEYANGTTISKHAFYYRVFTNLYCCCERKCLMCSDHFAKHADISFGDLWLKKYKRTPIKHSAIVARTKAATSLLKDSQVVLNLTETSVATVFSSQKRGALTHRNTTARKLAARLFNIKLNDPDPCRVSFFDFAIALIIMANYNASRSSKSARRLFLIPRPLLKIYLYTFKALETLRSAIIMHNWSK